MGARVEVYHSARDATTWMRGVSVGGMIAGVPASANGTKYVVRHRDEDSAAYDVSVDGARLRDIHEDTTAANAAVGDKVQVLLSEGRDAYTADGTKIFVPGHAWVDATVVARDDDGDDIDDEDEEDVYVSLPEWSTRVQGARACIYVPRDRVRRRVQ